MQLELGQKIRVLRHRDGRTQEMLADALGVTSQAISRWEANGGYPDMEMIPSIANYFGVSIDELFGYSKERQEKLKVILEKAEKAIDAQIDMTETVEMLRCAAEEFPSEPTVFIKLGYALNMCGWQKFGGRSYTEDGSDYACEDIEYNAQNPYWQEEIKVFEKVLTMDIPQEDRDTITYMLVEIYAKTGDTNKAKALALKQASIDYSREVLLTCAQEGEDRDRYQGEAIIALLTKLQQIIWSSVMTKISLFSTPTGNDILISLTKFYESVFSDGKCGKAHLQIRDLYLTAALNESRHGKNTDQAVGFFEKAFAHHKAFEAIDRTGVYCYSAPLVAKVAVSAGSLPPEQKHFWKMHFTGFATDEFKERLKEDPRFAECFEE